MTGFWNKQYLPHSLDQIMRSFYNLAEGKQRSNQEHYDEFNSMVADTAKESGATIGAHQGGVTKILTATARDINNPTEAEHAVSVHAATQWYLAVALLLGADRTRYGTLIEEIENEFLRN
jgi:hypothetical protein